MQQTEEPIVPYITDISQLDPDGIYTYADYLTWRFLERVELIHGRLFKMSPPPNRVHQEVSRQFCGPFFNYFKGEACQFFVAPFDVRLPSVKKGPNIYTVVQPDLCVICDPSKLDDRGAIGAPDLVVEIVSPGNSRRELNEKFQVYEQSGVREYWVVHPLEKAVWQYILSEDQKLICGQPVVFPDTLTCHIFPDLQIDLQEVFLS